VHFVPAPVQPSPNLTQELGEGICYQQYKDVFESLSAAHRCVKLTHVEEPNLCFEYMFANGVVGLFWPDGREPQFQQRKIHPLLRFQNAAKNASLFFFVCEAQPIERPLNVPIASCRVVLSHLFLFGGHVTYEAIKTVEGACLETATLKEPTYSLRLHVQRDHYPDCDAYSRSLYTKACALLGIGPEPLLYRSSFKKLKLPKEKKHKPHKKIKCDAAASQTSQ
jgi:hypothetical protein